MVISCLMQFIRGYVSTPDIWEARRQVQSFALIYIKRGASRNNNNKNTIELELFT